MDIFHSQICDADSSCNFSHFDHRDLGKYYDLDNFHSRVCDADNPDNVSRLDHRDPDKKNHRMASYSDANSHKDGMNSGIRHNDMGGDYCNRYTFDNNYHNEVGSLRRRWIVWIFLYPLRHCLLQNQSIGPPWYCLLQNQMIDPPVEFSMEDYDKAVQDSEYLQRTSEPFVETPTAKGS